MINHYLNGNPLAKLALGCMRFPRKEATVEAIKIVFMGTLTNTKS